MKPPALAGLILSGLLGSLLLRTLDDNQLGFDEQSNYIRTLLTQVQSLAFSLVGIFLVTAVLGRFFEQNGRAALAATEAAAVSGRLWALVRERGLPRALREGECGVPGGMSEAG